MSGLGSSIQIAIFVVPLLVLLSYLIAAQPMDLVFSRAEILAVMFAVFIVNQIAAESKSTWFGGVQLLLVYAIIGLSCYFIP